MNRIILSGNLVNDGEIRTTQSNKEVYSGRIAVNRGVKNSDDEYITDYFNLVCWNPTEYIKNNAKKGNRALVEGKIINRDYDDKDGNKKYATEVLVEHFEIYTKQEKKTESKEQVEEIPQNVKTEYQDNGIVLTDNDLPF